MGREGRHIPNRLRKSRRARGHSQKMVKHILGIKSPNQVSRWEHGKAIPSLENLLLLYLLYQTPIEELYSDYLEELRPQFLALLEKYTTKL